MFKIINSINLLKILYNKELPIKVSYKISKNIRKIDEEILIYEEERKKIINRHTIEVEDGSLEIENEEEVNDKISELVNMKVSLEIEKINIDEFLDSDIKIKPSEIAIIDYIIE